MILMTLVVRGVVPSRGLLNRGRKRDGDGAEGSAGWK